MQRKTTLSIIVSIAVPLVLTAALAAMCWWGVQQSDRADALEQSARERVRQTYYELADNLSDMQLSLKKLTVVNSPRQYALLLSDVWRSSGAAAASMSALPVSHPDAADMNRFVVQAGDYARQLEGRVLSGQIVSQEDQQQLFDLYEASVTVTGRLNERMETGTLVLDALDTEGYYAQTLSQEGGGQDQAGGGAAQPGQEETGGSGQGGDTETKSSDSVSDYPTLIYDGPFSDSTEKAQPRGLGSLPCDLDTARRTALSYIRGGSLTDAGEQGGAMAAYLFTGADPDGKSVEIAVTKQGGRVLWMMTPVEGAEEGVPQEQITAQYRQSAQNYLSARGYGDMEATYAQYYSGVAVLNFAAVQEGVILYPDLVKVYVERATGRVAGVDANNYLFSHTQRALNAPAITQQEAADGVSEQLSVQSVRLALIPKTPSVELLCYEFKGQCRGASFIVYVNALTGGEEEIFEIVNSDEGQLVV